MTERGRAARSNRTAAASLRPEIPVLLAAAMSLVANEDFQHVDMTKRAGEISAAGLENLMTIVANPRQFKIPDWFLNRKKDYTDGRYSQVVSNALDMKLRDDLELLKKIMFDLWRKI